MPTSPVPHLSAAPVPAQSIGALSRLFDKSALFFPGCTGLVVRGHFTPCSPERETSDKSSLLFSVLDQLLHLDPWGVVI